VAPTDRDEFLADRAAALGCTVDQLRVHVLRVRLGLLAVAVALGFYVAFPGAVAAIVAFALPGCFIVGTVAVLRGRRRPTGLAAGRAVADRVPAGGAAGEQLGSS
jgi:hypothetical protein